MTYILSYRNVMWPSSHSFTRVITSIDAGSQHEAALWCLSNWTAECYILQLCSAFPSQLLGVFLLSYLVAIKLKC